MILLSKDVFGRVWSFSVEKLICNSNSRTVKGSKYGKLPFPTQNPFILPLAKSCVNLAYATICVLCLKKKSFNVLLRLFCLVCGKYVCFKSVSVTTFSRGVFFPSSASRLLPINHSRVLNSREGKPTKSTPFDRNQRASNDPEKKGLTHNHEESPSTAVFFAVSRIPYHQPASGRAKKKKAPRRGRFVKNLCWWKLNVLDAVALSRHTPR